LKVNEIQMRACFLCWRRLILSEKYLFLKREFALFGSTWRKKTNFRWIDFVRFFSVELNS